MLGSSNQDTTEKSCLFLYRNGSKSETLIWRHSRSPKKRRWICSQCISGCVSKFHYISSAPHLQVGFASLFRDINFIVIFVILETCFFPWQSSFFFKKSPIFGEMFSRQIHHFAAQQLRLQATCHAQDDGKLLFQTLSLASQPLGSFKLLFLLLGML